MHVAFSPNLDHHIFEMVRASTAYVRYGRTSSISNNNKRQANSLYSCVSPSVAYVLM